MNIRKKFENQIKKKLQEIENLAENRDELDAQIREARSYIQGIEDMMKHLPADNGSEGDTASLRPGSQVYKVCEYLKKTGNQQHIRDILIGLGEEPTKNRRQALSGQLSAYVRRNEIFTRHLPNTFGLIEFDQSEQKELDEISIESGQIPETFGNLQ